MKGKETRRKHTAHASSTPILTHYSRPRPSIRKINGTSRCDAAAWTGCGVGFRSADFSPLLFLQKEQKCTQLHTAKRETLRYCCCGCCVYFLELRIADSTEEEADKDVAVEC